METVSYKKYLPVILWVLFSAFLMYFKLAHHELWKDEWQAYLVARDQGWLEMFSFLNYEGHPSLWYIWLKISSLFSVFFGDHQENLILISHGLLGIAVYYLLLVKMDMPILVKLGLAVSYFLGHQYGIVSRGYILVLLLGLLSVSAIKHKNGTLLAFYLFFLCQTEVYGVFIAGMLLLYYLLLHGSTILEALSSSKKEISGLALGFLAFVITVYPRGNRDDFSRAYNQNSFDIDNLLTAFQGNLANALLPGIIKDTGIYGWAVPGLLLSIAVLALLYMIFRKQKPALYAMVALLGVMVLFGMVIFTGGIRQWGMSYIGFALLVCLVADEHWIKDRWVMGAFVLIAAVQLVHNTRAHLRDYHMPFSITEEVGKFIKEKVPDNVPVVAINKFETAAVGAYADRPLHELPDGKEFTYFKWLEKVYIPTQSELTLFAKFKNVGGLVLVSPTPIDANRFPNAQLWQSFDNPTYKMEKMYVYSVPVK